MADGDDPTRRSSRFPKRSRVTLKWDAAPLTLPGEGDASPPASDESTELALPGDASESETAARASSSPPPEPSIGADAWERQRPRLTPPPFRPPSSSPPPPGPDEGGALDLVDRRSRPAAPGDLAVEMSDRYALGDYTAALRTAELILGRDPENELAQQIAEGCRERLLALYRSRLGSLARVPEVAVETSEARWLGLDHRAGFLLSRVDGVHTMAELVDVSGMAPLEALKTFVELLEASAIRFRD